MNRTCAAIAALLTGFAASAASQEATPHTPPVPVITEAADGITGMAQQTSSPLDADKYSLNVSVNEVGITFHAADSNNHPVTDLKLGDVDLFDNDKGPGQIVSLRLLPERAVHAAFVIDTSGSVVAQVARSRTEASEAAQKLLTEVQDEGITVMFGRARRVVQSWTRDRKQLLGSIRQALSPHDPVDGTAVYDTLFSTCHYEFGNASTGSANVILLFSDGVDNNSYMSLQAAADACRKNHVAIYAFSPKPDPGMTSTGPPKLRQLVELTGGRFFYDDPSEGGVQADIATVGSDLRSEYLLIYRPKRIIHDGAFHSIVLVGPKRVDKMVAATGFYAPAHSQQALANRSLYALSSWGI